MKEPDLENMTLEELIAYASKLVKELKDNFDAMSIKRKDSEKEREQK